MREARIRIPDKKLLFISGGWKRSSLAVMGRGRARSAPICVLNSLERRVMGEKRGQNPLVSLCWPCRGRRPWCRSCRRDSCSSSSSTRRCSGCRRCGRNSRSPPPQTAQNTRRTAAESPPVLYSKQTFKYSSAVVQEYYVSGPERTTEIIPDPDHGSDPTLKLGTDKYLHSSVADLE